MDFTPTAKLIHITDRLVSTEGQDGEDEEAEQCLRANVVDGASGIDVWVESVVY